MMTVRIMMMKTRATMIKTRIMKTISTGDVD